MNILFCVGCELNATSRIGYNIASYLSSENDCYVVFMNRKINKIEESYKDNMNIYDVPAINRYQDNINLVNQKLETANKLSTFLTYPIQSIEKKYFDTLDYCDYKEYINFINSLVVNKKIDFVIAFCAPFKHCYEIANNVKNCKIIYYQTDPYGIHELLPKLTKNKRVKEELEIIRITYLTFTTDVLYNQYLNNKLYSKYKSKYHVSLFPNLFIHKNSVKYDSNYYDIFYFGVIDDKYRDPKKIFSFILNANHKTRIIIYGDIYSDEINKLKEIFKDRIIVNNRISMPEVNAFMDMNIMLLNINNKMKNQSPSKLIEYMSSGNPIINSSKRKDDISHQILNQYEYKYNYEEYEMNQSKESFNYFLKNYYGKKYTSDFILNNYSDYTIEKVSKNLINELSKL